MAITGTPEAFRLKFSEAIDYLKAKLPEGTHAWDDLAGPVHAKVFAVAGATKVDLVQDLHNAITRAIEQGRTITDFRKDFDKAVQAHGWSYKGKRGWRTRVIYDANMRSAHMAGRWAQLQANKERKPCKYNPCPLKGRHRHVCHQSKSGKNYWSICWSNTTALPSTTHRLATTV